MELNHRCGRRRFVAGITAGCVVGLSGCSGLLGGNKNTTKTDNLSVPSLGEFRGSGALIEGRPAPGGTLIEELPELSGEMNLYIGGGEGGIYYQFVEMLQQIYPEFTVYSSDGPSSSLAQTVVKEVNAGAPQADVFWSIDASSLGYVTDKGAYKPLSKQSVKPVPDAFTGTDRAWVGVAGRARSVPYNTEQLNADEIPKKVSRFPEKKVIEGMGWAPTYGAFKSFVTAMRLIRGKTPTRNWLTSMKQSGTQDFPNEYVVSQRVADGAIPAGFANHYYAMRVKNQRPDASIDLAFTEGDAGALIDVAGALKVNGTKKDELVDDFVRHLLSAEAQEYFATVSYAYPMIPEVEPVGGLPTIDELDPPEIDLSELSKLEPTLTLMREAGVLG